MTSLKQFTDRNGVKDIDAVLIDAVDSASAVVQLSLASPPIPPATASIPIPIVPGAFANLVAGYVMARTGAKPTDVLGLMAPGLGLMSKLELDVNLLVVPLLLAGATSLNLKPVPGPPVPAVPVVPVNLAAVPIPDPNALKFGKSLMEWALSFIQGDPRIAGTITVALP